MYLVSISFDGVWFMYKIRSYSSEIYIYFFLVYLLFFRYRGGLSYIVAKIFNRKCRETKTPAVPYLQQLLVDGQIWFCTEIFCQFSFCQEILIKLSGDTLNNLSNNLGSFRRILQGMGIYRQNIYYRACLWCGLRTLQRIFLHGQLWLKTFLRFELNFYWILIPVKILLPLKSKYIKTQLGTWRQCMQVEVWKCGSIVHCIQCVQCRQPLS